MRNVYLVVILSMACAVLPVLIACERSADDREPAPVAARGTPGAPKRGGQLVIGVQQEPERLSEILNATATTSLVCNLIFRKFVKYDDTMQLVPDLIERIPSVANGDVSADRLAYTYRLRRDARWHDGPPVTARDVRFTWEIIMDPAVNVESREGWDVIDAVEVEDLHTVTFRLREPYPDFVAETFYDEPVLPAHVLRDERGERFHRAAFHRRPVGNGPFRFHEWIPGGHLTVVRNDDYAGGGPYLDRIIFKFIPDAQTMLLQLQTGEIDVCDNVDVQMLESVKNVAGVRVYETPSLMYEHIDINTEHPILSDRRVRLALAAAVDRWAIVRDVYHGLALVAPLDEHPSSPYYASDVAARVHHDPATARRLLQQAGWIDSDGDGIRERDGEPLVLTISATSGNPNRERTEILLQHQLKAVGIDLRIRNYHATVLYGAYEDGGILKRGEFDLAMYAWLSSPEPASKEALYAADNVPPHGQNHPRFRHDELTRLVKAGATETDEDARVRVYHDVARILVEEVPVIPLFWYTTVDVGSERLANYRPNPTQSADTWNAYAWFLDD